MKKEILAKTIEVNDLIESGDSIQQAITKLHDLQNDYYMYTRSIFDKNYYGYDGAYELELHCYRMETDKEEQDREEKERIALEKREKIRLKQLEKTRTKKDKKEAEERAEYERLKAKYGE